MGIQEGVNTVTDLTELCAVLLHSIFSELGSSQIAGSLPCNNCLFLWKSHDCGLRLNVTISLLPFLYCQGEMCFPLSQHL